MNAYGPHNDEVNQAKNSIACFDDMLYWGPLTDLGNAERFAWENIGRHCYDTRHAKWRYWDGRIWCLDNTGETIRAAQRVVREIDQEIDFSDFDPKKILKWARASESSARLKALLELAETQAHMYATENSWNSDPLLMNVTNGTINLRTGKLRASAYFDKITQLAPVPYDPQAKCPLWDKFLTDTFKSEAIIRFVQRAIGYSACGDTSEEKFFLMQGAGATGKSTLLESVKSVLGDYSSTVEFETFLKRKGDGGIRNDLARLEGARFISAGEVDRGRSLSSAVIKSMTGRDTITVRFLYKELFSYRPQGKIWLCANEMPHFDVDDAMKRRAVLIPFNYVVPMDQRNPKLKDRFQTNDESRRAILAWIVQGCLDWQKEGLNIPEILKDRTAELFDSMDAFDSFIKNRCELGKGCEVASRPLIEAYRFYASSEGVPDDQILSDKQLAQRLKAAGCQPQRTSKCRNWAGVRLRG